MMTDSEEYDRITESEISQNAMPYLFEPVRPLSIDSFEAIERNEQREHHCQCQKCPAASSATYPGAYC